MNMKTIVKANFDKTLYAVTIIPHDYKWAVPLNMLQESISTICLDAKVISNDGHIEIITQIGKSAEIDQIKLIQETLVSVLAAAHDIHTSYTAFKDRLLGIKHDFARNVENKPTTSPTEESSCKGQ